MRSAGKPSWAWIAGLGGAVALFVVGLAWIRPSQAFLGAYLVGWLFWLQVSLGCLALGLIWGLAGGRWMEPCGRTVAATAWTWPLLAALALPLMAGSDALYSDVRESMGVGYRGQLGFALRMGLCLLALGVLAWRFVVTFPARWKLGGGGLVVFGLAISFGSVDWMMSIQPHFHSAVAPFTLFADAMVAGLSFVAASFWWKKRRVGGRGLYQLGKLYFAAVFFWGYIAFSQFIVIWSANLPHEAAWYGARTEGMWQAWTAGLAALHFGAPFAALLSRRLKESVMALALLGSGMLAARWGGVCWSVLPSLEQGAREALAGAVCWLAVGGLWFWLWALGYRRLSLEKGYMEKERSDGR